MKNINTTDGKILIVDIEVSPMVSYSYPPMWQTNTFNVIQYQVLMSFSYKWLGESKVHHVQLPDFKARYKADKYDDKDITIALHKVFDEANVIVGHNIRGFDIKMANTFFVKHGLGAPSPYKTVDTLVQARRIFKYPSNRLDEISKYQGRKGKTEVKVGQLWYPCLVDKDMASWKLMREYNNQDVVETENTYLIQRGFDRSHPNLGVILNKQGVCAHCGHDSTSFQSRGIENRVSGPVRRYWCNPSKGGCGGWNYPRYIEPEERLVKEDRPDFVAG